MRRGRGRNRNHASNLRLVLLLVKRVPNLTYLPFVILQIPPEATLESPFFKLLDENPLVFLNPVLLS
jgi:hypothetical protein